MPAKLPLIARLRALMEDSSFLREYLWKYRKLVAAGLLSLVVVDLLEVLPPILLKEAVDLAVERKPLTELALLAWIYVGVALVQALGRYGWRMYLVRSSLLTGRDLRDRFTGHLFGLAQSFFDRRPIGELMSLSTSDTESVRNMLGHGLIVLADAVFYFMTVPVAMFWLSPKLALLSFVFLPIVPWLVMRNERLVHDRYQRAQESFTRLSALTQEALNGVRITKAFAKEETQNKRFRELGQEYVQRNLSLARVQIPFGPMLDFCMSLGLVLLLFAGGSLIIRDGDAALTLGTFVAFQRFIQKMIWPMAAVGMALNTYQRSVTSSKRLKEVLAQSTDVPETDTARLHCLPVGARTPGRVEFRNLSFGFPRADREILKGIDLVIEPGERVAFVGTIGAGKSALLGLLPRLYPVARGMVLVDGIDVNDWRLSDLRRQVGYVGQDVFLFSDTVLENVAYGLASGFGHESPDLIHQAAHLACVHDDVLGLTGSYSTRVGERGVTLSGGQKQRLTIARAIVKEPPILVLDDALSSVDVQTEERILRGLRARPGRNTEIIAAHRISTIQDADRIVVLENGRIAQLGPHVELLRQGDTLYRRFYEQQRLKEDLENYVGRLEEARP